jgi:hypothetical protein
MFGMMRREARDLAWLLRTLTVLAVAAAVYRELRLPPRERTWHGKLIGVVPYDFRLPSLARIRDAYWNPGGRKVLTDRPLGVGWAVNVPVLLRRLKRLRGRSSR